MFTVCGDVLLAYLPCQGERKHLALQKLAVPGLGGIPGEAPPSQRRRVGNEGRFREGHDQEGAVGGM